MLRDRCGALKPSASDQGATIAAPARTQLDRALVGRHRFSRQAPARAIEHRDPQGLERRIIIRLRADRDARENVAFDRDGRPTRDPAAALAGAFAAWGGHKGSGLGIVVQLLGIMAGSPPIPPDLAGFGFLIVTMRPDLLGPAETFRDNVSAYAQAVRTARPVAGGDAVRMPFDRSRGDRKRRLDLDRIDVPDVLFEQLTRLAGAGPA